MTIAMDDWTIDDCNFDGMTVDDVRAFIAFVGNGVRPIVATRKLFPDMPKGAVNAVKAYRNYAWNKLTAMNLRIEGRIESALTYERICDRIYDELPEFARW